MPGAERRAADPGCTRTYKVGLQWWDRRGGEGNHQSCWGLGEEGVNSDRGRGQMKALVEVSFRCGPIGRSVVGL